MSRFRGSYTTILDELEFLDDEDLRIIESKAKGLSFADCLDFLCVAEIDIPKNELKLAKMAHKRGRVSAISKACESLFSSMNGKAGHQASIEYLKVMSSTFQLEPTSSSSGGFSFNVVMPEK